MTGFGAGVVEVPTARLTVEIRGVNQRHLEVRVLGAREFAPWEVALRDRVRARVRRGRVDVTVTRTPIASRRRYRVAIREELARAAADAGRRFQRQYRLAGEFTVGDLLKLPDVLEVRELPVDPRRELPAVLRALERALTAFDRQCRREGRALQADMTRRLATIAATVRHLHRALPAADRALAARIRTRVTEAVTGTNVDAARLAADVAQLVGRGDVTEELVRLDSHLAALRAAAWAAGEVGKRIEFLLQETQRELNTTGAKLGDAALAHAVLRAKEEVEKLREQVQNVE